MFLEGIAQSGTIRDDDAPAKEYSPPAFSMSGAAESLHIRIQRLASTIWRSSLEVCYLIAQSSRKFELQIGRGRVHLRGELLYQVGEVARWQPGQPPRLRTHILGSEGRYGSPAAPLPPAEQVVGVRILSRPACR